MMYVKGSKDDFDAWEKLGAVNWSHADVEPYFKKVEDTTALNFSNKMRGSSGPLKLSFPYIAPITHAFVNAGMELGKKLISKRFVSVNWEFHFIVLAGLD